MGFENRDYYRESDYTGAAAGWGSEYITPIVKYLIIANVVVFLLQIFFTRAMTRADYDAQQELIPKAYRDRVSKTPLDEEAKAALEKALKPLREQEQQYLEEMNGTMDIEDPVGGSVERYRECAAELKKYINRILDRWEQES